MIPKLTLIAAMDTHGIIGVNNGMPWHLPADFAFFKQQTMGKHLLMGRKTYQSIGRPLPGRSTIILSRTMQEAPPSTMLINDLSQLNTMECEEIMVAGGSQIYQQTIELADQLILTHVHAELDHGDAYFPKIETLSWQAVKQDFRPADEKNKFDMTFTWYQKL
ncbi:MAG: dihydrofolate reductase [bacterium]